MLIQDLMIFHPCLPSEVHNSLLLLSLFFLIITKFMPAVLMLSKAPNLLDLHVKCFNFWTPGSSKIVDALGKQKPQL